MLIVGGRLSTFHVEGSCRKSLNMTSRKVSRVDIILGNDKSRIELNRDLFRFSFSDSWAADTCHTTQVLALGIPHILQP